GELCDIVASDASGGTAQVTVVDGRVSAVALIDGGSGYTGSQAELKSQTGDGRGCLVTVSQTAGVISAIEKRSGWYLLVHGGQRHDPVMLGAVVGTGEYSVKVEIDWASIGIDPADWTPSG